jgi:hypothetical protein
VHQKSKGAIFRGIVMVCTSLWYEHAVQTMAHTFKGRLANRLIIWWQFKSLYWTPNFLHSSGSVRFWHWIWMFFAPSLLDHDALLCKFYGIDYRAYLDSLDLRSHVQTSPSVYFLASYNDPMFSDEHMRETELALQKSNVKYKLTEFGSHGDFSIKTRNDYLVEYVTSCLDELLAKDDSQ